MATSQFISKAASTSNSLTNQSKNNNIQETDSSYSPIAPRRPESGVLKCDYCAPDPGGATVIAQADDRDAFTANDPWDLGLATHSFTTNFERMAEFYCAPCKVQLNSRSQWDYHVVGVKHRRAVTVSTSEVDISAAIVLLDGTFKCKSCDDFVCSGRIPFEQHLVGQRHLKNEKAVSVSSSEVNISAIVLPDGSFRCKSCDGFVCSGPIPFEQHLAGQRHLKNIQRHKESTQSSSSSSSSSPVKSPLPELPITSLVNSFQAMNNGSLPNTETQGSSALLQPDGSYKCKVCPGFICSGRIPMQDHLKGKSHLKNLNNFPERKLAFEQLSISTPEPKGDYFQISLTVDERIEKAWNHQTICGYIYDESFSSLSIEKKIEVLSPHFAFIGKDDPMPNFVKYLSMW